MDVKFFDSIYEGDSSNGFKLGMGLTNGDFWPRPDGCSMLYRGGSMETIDFDILLAVEDIDTLTFSPVSYLEHTAGVTYFYVVRKANNCGDMEYTLGAAVRVSIGDDGELTKAHANNVLYGKIGQFSGGKVFIVWSYCSIEQKSEPVVFKVFYDSRTGVIDYENAIATVNYAGPRFYIYQSGSLLAGEYLFAIKVENANGVVDGCLDQLSIEVDSGTPLEIGVLGTESI